LICKNLCKFILGIVGGVINVSHAFYQFNISTVAGILDIQILNTVQMKLSGKQWQCVSGLQKCMDYHMKGN